MDNTVKYLERATQLDPQNSYAFTLLGLEYLKMKEEGAKCLAAFQTATKIDPRNFTAW